MIHLALPDDPAGKAMAEALVLNGLAKLVESDSSLQLASVDDRMKHALDCLEQEHRLVHKYDYVWIMRYINEEHIKDTGLFFYSVNSYRDYVITYMGHHDVAGVSTMSLYYSYGEDQLPLLPQKLQKQASAIAQKVMRELVLVEKDWKPFGVEW